MSKKMLAAVTIAMVLALVGYGTLAYAGEGCCAAKSGAAACPAAKGAECPKDMKVTMTGTVEVKTEGNVKTASRKVSEAKADDGKTCCEAMKGKDIKLSGDKAVDAEKLAGKQAEVKGVCKAGKELEVASVTEKK